MQENVCKRSCELWARYCRERDDRYDSAIRKPMLTIGGNNAAVGFGNRAVPDMGHTQEFPESNGEDPERNADN